MSANLSEFDNAKTLLIDDNAHHRAIVLEVLRAAGVEDVITARNGMEGLEEFRRQRPRVVLVDWVMEPIDGPTFTVLARRADNPLTRSTPIIMLTARSRRQDLEEARAVGVDDVLIKPVNAQLLITKIRDVLARPRRFVDSNNYAGPCRRRHLDAHYAGPWRRRSDTTGKAVAHPAIEGRIPLSASVERLNRSMALLRKGLTDSRAVISAAQETAALAHELNDFPLERGAQSLINYVGTIQHLDGGDPVLQTHALALTKLIQTTESAAAERESVAEALEQLVTRRAARAG